MKIRFYDEYDHWTYGGESFTQRFEPVVTAHNRNSGRCDHRLDNDDNRVCSKIKRNGLGQTS